MKGARPDEEIAALPPGWTVRGMRPLSVPGLDAERHLVTVARTGETVDQTADETNMTA